MNTSVLPDAPTAHRRGEAAPRRRVLLGLGAGVLVAHLGLLSGGFSGLSFDLFAAPDTELSGAPPAAAPNATDTAVMALPQTPVEPVRSSRVRWILPKAPEPEPEPEPPPPVVKKPPPPPPVVEPEVVPEPQVEPSTDVALVTPTEPPPDPPLEIPAEETASETVEQPVTVSVGPPVVQAVATPADPVSDAAAGTQVAAGTVQGAGMGLSEAGLPPALVPPSVRLSYQVKGLAKGFNYVASGTLDWAHDGQTYQATMTVKALFLGSRSQTSNGRISDKGLAPDRFTDRSRSERAAHFERASARIRYSNNAPDAALLPGAQDRLSVNLQLAALFNARPDAYAEGQTLRLPVSSHDVSEVWLFQVGPTSTERLPAGEIATRQLLRIPRKPYDRKVEIWLAQDLLHLPVRLRITEPNGDFVDMQLAEMPKLATIGNVAAP
jgi:hypothetical protein